MTDERNQLDALLDAYAPPPLPPGLRMRVLAHAPRPRRGFFAELWTALGGTKVAAPAFACALALGLGLGMGFDGVAPGDSIDDGTELDAIEWALVDQYTDFGT